MYPLVQRGEDRQGPQVEHLHPHAQRAAQPVPQMVQHLLRIRQAEVLLIGRVLLLSHPTDQVQTVDHVIIADLENAAVLVVETVVLEEAEVLEKVDQEEVAALEVAAVQEVGEVLAVAEDVEEEGDKQIQP